MATCAHHPDVPSSTRCRLCEQYFCLGCLVPVERVGLVCAECEALLSPFHGEDLMARVPALRRQARAQVPPPRGWWGWDVSFWIAACLPTVFLGAALWGQLQQAGWLTQLGQEPHRPAIAMQHLVATGTALERFYTSRKSYPSSLDALLHDASVEEEMLQDPYGKNGERLLYRIDGALFSICSRGPDRIDDEGAILDRFDQKGDLCLGELAGQR